jgi:tRNA1(Val) A37 N6-methylase TrmN6
MSSLEENLKCDIFTPDFISLKMAGKLLNSGTLLDPCVGTGNLLKFLNIDNYTQVDLYELKDEYINDIKDSKNIYKYIGDFLKMNINYKYTNIILNPPYIKIQELEADYRKFLRDNFKLKGNLDIYYAFILKCINLLSDDGIMVRI